MADIGRRESSEPYVSSSSAGMMPASANAA